MEVVLARLDDLFHQRRRLRHATLTDVELMLADSDALIAAVKSGRLDAAVVVRPASGGSRRLDWRALRSQPSESRWMCDRSTRSLRWCRRDGVSIVPQPRQALLDAHGVRAVALGRRRPARQIAFVARRADAENRNVAAVAEALMG